MFRCLFMSNKCQKDLKGIVSVISIDPPCNVKIKTNESFILSIMWNICRRFYRFKKYCSYLIIRVPLWIWHCHLRMEGHSVPLKGVFEEVPLKRVFEENERGCRLTSKNIWWWLLLMFLLFVVSIRRKLLKTTQTEERSIHTNSESC